MGNGASQSARGSVSGSLASLASLLAALSCCLPAGTLLLAAGSAGASVLLESLRPWLLAFSICCLVFAFLQTYLRNRCEFRHRRLGTLLLWFSAAVVVGTLAFPVRIASLASGVFPAGVSAGRLQTFDEASFLRDFNEASVATRVVVLLSPT